MTRASGAASPIRHRLRPLLLAALAGLALSQADAQEPAPAGAGGEEAIIERLRAVAHPLRTAEDLDPLIERIGDARFVLIGEATHGTSEFYLWRARLTQRLIEEEGFDFIGVEGDWPNIYELNRYVSGESRNGADAHEVLDEFARWPTWMWANWEVAAFAEWLRRHNASLPEGRKVGIYGLDLYSLWDSMQVIRDILVEADPATQEAARQAFLCFGPYGEDEQAYARATLRLAASCEDEAAALLAEVQATQAWAGDPEAVHFDIEQNARVVVNAEDYYRAMVIGGPLSWNIRDRHMADTLDRLTALHGPDARAILWEHNTHVGDARATDMAAQGQINIGQLARERHGEEAVVLVGFGTHRGTVVAGQEWGAPLEAMDVPPAVESSWEALFHRAGLGDVLVLTADLLAEAATLDPRGHRAIGVVYNPLFEAFGNYVPTVLPRRYDAFIYLEETEALHPLHAEPRSRTPPPAYPWGF